MGNGILGDALGVDGYTLFVFIAKFFFMAVMSLVGYVIFRAVRTLFRAGTTEKVTPTQAHHTGMVGAGVPWAIFALVQMGQTLSAHPWILPVSVTVLVCLIAGGVFLYLRTRKAAEQPGAASQGHAWTPVTPQQTPVAQPYPNNVIPMRQHTGTSTWSPVPAYDQNDWSQVTPDDYWARPDQGDGQQVVR